MWGLCPTNVILCLPISPSKARCGRIISGCSTGSMVKVSCRLCVPHRNNPAKEEEEGCWGMSGCDNCSHAVWLCDCCTVRASLWGAAWWSLVINTAGHPGTCSPFTRVPLIGMFSHWSLCCLNVLNRFIWWMSSVSQAKIQRETPDFS